MYVDILDIQGSLISPWGGIEPPRFPSPSLIPFHLARKQRGRGNKLVYL
jgi:hypothetical protein